MSAPDSSPPYSLKHYLHTVWLPVFRAKDAPFLDPEGRAGQWPAYDDLRRPTGTRRLGTVTRFDLAQLRRETSNYFALLPDVGVARASATSLMLPNGELLDLDGADRQYLALIGGEGRFLKLVERYVLATLSAALRLVHRLPATVPLGEALAFRETPQFCSVWRSKWSVLYLAGGRPGTFDVAVVCLPPWDFGFADFEEFVRPQEFNVRLDAPGGQAGSKLWAALYDVCAGRGFHFVVTTYDRWAVGRFSDDWSVVQVTQTMWSPIREFDGQALYADEEDAPNVMEMILYWIQVGRGAAVTGELGDGGY